LKTIASASKIRFILAFISILFSATQSLRAQESPWDKYIKAGDKAEQGVYGSQKAEKQYEAALEETKKFPANDLRTAETLGKLANIYMERNRFPDAEYTWKQAISILEPSVGPDDPRLAHPLLGLALVYDIKDSPEEAAPNWSRSLAILKKTGGPLADMERFTMVNQGRILASQGKYTSAEQIFQFILDLEENTGASDIDLRNALRELAGFYGKAKRDSDAEATFLRILEIDVRTFGPDGTNTGTDARSLGGFYLSRGRYAAAMPLLQRNLEILQKGAKPEDSSAKRAYRDAVTGLDIVELIPSLFLFHGEALLPLPMLNPGWHNNSDLIRETRDLATVCYKAGKYPEAEEVYKHLIPTDEKKDSSGNVYQQMDLADDLRNLSRVYRHEHRYDEALAAIKRSEVIDQRVGNPKNVTHDQPALWQWYDQTERAEIFRVQGDTAAAEPLFAQSLDMVGKIPLWEGHPRIAEMFGDYATLLRDEGKLDEAESLYKRALDSWAKNRARNFDPDQLQDAEILTNYAELLRKLDRAAEAESLEQQAQTIRAKISAMPEAN